MVMELANQRTKLEAVSCEWGLYEGVKLGVRVSVFPNGKLIPVK